MASSRIVDPDTHILEPADLWEKNLEPKYKDQPMRISRDEKDLEYFNVNGVKSDNYQGGELTPEFTGVGRSQQWMEEPADTSYAEAGTLTPARWTLTNG